MHANRTLWAKARAANISGASYDLGLSALTTSPPAAPWLPPLYDYINLMFFGTGNDDTTATARILGARLVADSTLWIVEPLAEFSLILSTDVGAVGQYVLNTERYADTITQVYGASSIRVISPTGNVRGNVLMDVSDCQYIGVDLKKGTCTNVNALYAWVRPSMGLPVVIN